MEEKVRQQVRALMEEYGADAVNVAERRMQGAMDRNDVREAGDWLSVMYEVTRLTMQDS